MRFDYEWGSGNEDDYKPRPCAIIVRGIGPRVFYFSISHEPPRDDDEALEIPAKAREAAGLDRLSAMGDRQPVRVRWIPGRKTAIYGTLPPDFVQLFRNAVAAVSRRQLLRGRDRLPNPAPDPPKPGEAD